MNIEERENIEWVNYWWEKANNAKIKRWVLLGDSVARQYRGKLQERVEPEVAIDFFGASLQLDDSRYKRELKNFFENSDYIYEIALITWGGHHGLRRVIKKDEESYHRYYRQYESLLKYVMLNCRKVVVIAATHEVLSDKLNKDDEQRNQQIQIRNEISMLLAQKYRMMYIDLYTYMYERKEEFHHVDHVHFQRDADAIMANYILCNMKLNPDSIGNVIKENVYKKNIDSVLEFEQILNQSAKIVLYGAGMVGRNFVKYINYRGKEIECFIVSDNQCINKHCNIANKVYHFSNYASELKLCTVIVTMMEDEVADILQKNKCFYWSPSKKVIEFVMEYVATFCN